MKIFRNVSRAIRRITGLGILAFSLLPFALPSHAQPSATVRPRVQTLFAAQWLTNGALPTNANGSTPTSSCVSNTFLPGTGSKPIALILSTWGFKGTQVFGSTIVDVYPAYDLGGNTGSTLMVMGTNFNNVAPLWSWTNTFASTNTNGTFVTFTTTIPTATWEPATALTYVIRTNTTIAGQYFSLQAAVVP